MRNKLACLFFAMIAALAAPTLGQADSWLEASSAKLQTLDKVTARISSLE